jgi:hypothetical protein
MKSNTSNYRMHFDCTWKDVCSREAKLFFHPSPPYFTLGDSILLISNPNGGLKTNVGGGLRGKGVQKTL